jgi:hypothetical protein
MIPMMRRGLNQLAERRAGRRGSRADTNGGEIGIGA